MVRLRYCSEGFVTALLFTGNHSSNIDVIVREGIPSFLQRGFRDGSCSAQDPGKVDVEEPEDVSAGVD